ncbi:hypothetical protein RF55_15566, partial [Lasius niger]
MSDGTRSKSNKDEVDKLYKVALTDKKSKSKLISSTSGTVHTSTPIRTPKDISKQIDLSLNSTLTEGNLSDSTLIADSPEPDSDGSVDITIQKFTAPTNIINKFENDSEIFETMALQNPFATLKYAVETVPFFDGKNIPISYFIEGCEEAKSMLPKEAEPQFTIIIRTRIVGEARRTIQDQDFDSVSRLTEFLKKIYDPSKNAYQLQGELGRVYQMKEEDVVTYANRVKILGKQILEVMRSSGHALPDQNIKAYLEKDMCKCFIRGLKPEIEQQIARNLDVQDTVADALRMERELRVMTDLRQNQHTTRSREICQICYKESVINIIQERNSTCQLCSKIGHNAKSCRQNITNQQPTKTSVICQWCDKSGHSANNCWKKQNEQRNLGNNFKVNIDKVDNHITLMLDTGSGPNILKENFIPKDININYTNILKLNGINNYPVYTLGEITLTLFELPVSFHIVSSDFPIPQSGILGNDFFKQTSSKIDYAQGHLNVSGINVPFFSPETIVVSPRSESSFYVRIGNPEVKMGYIPKLKVEHGLYLGDTIVENNSGKAHLNIISTLDEEVEVRVPTLRLKPLSELFDDHESDIEAFDNQKGEAPIILEESVGIDGTNVNEEYRECDIINKIQEEDEDEIFENEENKTENKNKIKIKRGNKNYSNKNINNPKILGEGSYQTSPENINNSKILGEGSYQTSPENLNNPKTLGGGNYHTPPEGDNSRISEGSFQTSSGNSSSVDCEEGSYQTSLSNSTQSYSKNPKGRSLLSSLDIKFPKIGLSTKVKDNKQNTSHITMEDLLKEAQKYNLNIENLNIKNSRSIPSSKISTSSLNKSQEIIDKFLRKRKSKNKEKQRIDVANFDLHNCLVVSEETKENRFTKIMELLRLEHLNKKEQENIIKLITNSQDRFHIPGENLTATHVLQHQISTTDDQPINTRQYRFPQIHKEEINKQVEELLEGGIVKQSQSPYNTPIWIVPKKEDSKGNKRWRMVLDFRALNDKTIGDAYPLPNIVDILDQLGGAQYFSVCDLASGFHQIKMDPADGHKTAFTTPFGHYEFDRMPFGLKNAPATFQRLMDLVLTGLQGEELFVYMDDIVIYATSLEEHERKYNALIERLRQANLKLQPDKCEFLKTEVTYLGHVIGRDGVKPDPKKLEAVQQFPRPKTPKNIKQFLGLAGYYRRFIPNFSKLA